MEISEVWGFVLNIAIFTDCYFPIKNGVVTSIAQLKSGLEARGHRVIIFTVEAKGYVETDSGVTRFRSLPIGLGTELAFGLVNQARVHRIIQSENIQLVHSHTEFTLCVSAALAARKFKLPRVQTTHTMWEEYRHYILNGWLLTGPLVRFLLRTQFRGCSGLVAPSNKAANYYGKLLPDIPLDVIPNGMDAEKFTNRNYTGQDLIQIRQDLGINPKDKVILFVGRIGREKRVIQLFESIVPVLQAMPETRLVFVGDGPELNELRIRCSCLKRAYQVVCTGYVNWESIRGIYSMADLFVTASMSEVHSMTMIEAMMCSLPVIARKDDSYLDSVQQSVNGYLVDSDAELGEKVGELILREDKLIEFGQASQRIAEGYTGQRHADRMADFYHYILARFGTETSSKEPG